MSRLSAVNLNQLVVFEAIFRTRSVSAAARELGLTQSGASNALAQLRLWFDDPLFVRAGNSMVPTHRATEIEPRVTEGLGSFREALRSPRFDAQQLTRTVRLAMPDYVQRALMSTLSARLSLEAPQARLRIRTVVDHAPPRELATGELDAYVGFVEQPTADHKADRLYDDDFVLLLRADHPARGVNGSVTLSAWLRFGHVVVTREPDAPTLIDRALGDRGLARRVTAVVDTASVVPDAVRASDWIAAVGRSWGESVASASHGTLAAIDCPLPLPAGRIRAVVHRRFEREPFHRWVLDLLKAVADDAGVSRSSP